MSLETKEAILFGQLQEGLHMELLRGPAVSGALGYKELCAAAKNEERRLSELKKRQTYLRPSNPSVTGKSNTPAPTVKKPNNSRSQLACYNCGKLGHLSCDYRSKKSSEVPDIHHPTTAGRDGIPVPKE